MWNQGTVRSQVLLESSIHYTMSMDTDFRISNFTPDTTRYYGIFLSTDWTMTASGEWKLHAQIDGEDLGRIGVAISDGTINEDMVTGCVIWQPDDFFGVLEYEVSIYAELAVGTSTLRLYADSGTPRQFWIQDLGAR